MILGGALTAFAQANSDLSRPLTLAPADATSSGGGASGSEDDEAQAAELAKKTLNPIASLISVPLSWSG